MKNTHVTKTKTKSLHVLLSNFFHPFVSVSRFPSCHFGKLYGVVMALSALFSLLQYPCFALVKGLLDGDPLYVSTQQIIENPIHFTSPGCSYFLISLYPPLFLQVNIGLTVLGLLAFIHPISVYIHCRRRAKERASS